MERAPSGRSAPRIGGAAGPGGGRGGAGGGPAAAGPRVRPHQPDPHLRPPGGPGRGPGRRPVGHRRAWRGPRPARPRRHDGAGGRHARVGQVGGREGAQRAGSPPVLAGAAGQEAWPGEPEGPGPPGAVPARLGDGLVGARPARLDVALRRRQVAQRGQREGGREAGAAQGGERLLQEPTRPRRVPVLLRDDAEAAGGRLVGGAGVDAPGGRDGLRVGGLRPRPASPAGPASRLGGAPASGPPRCPRAGPAASRASDSRTIHDRLTLFDAGPARLTLR